jgi:hypothetical protein
VTQLQSLCPDADIVVFSWDGTTYDARHVDLVHDFVAPHAFKLFGKLDARIERAIRAYAKLVLHGKRGKNGSVSMSRDGGEGSGIPWTYILNCIINYIIFLNALDHVCVSRRLDYPTELAKVRGIVMGDDINVYVRKFMYDALVEEYRRNADVTLRGRDSPYFVDWWYWSGHCFEENDTRMGYEQFCSAYFVPVLVDGEPQRVLLPGLGTACTKFALSADHLHPSKLKVRLREKAVAYRGIAPAYPWLRHVVAAALQLPEERRSSGVANDWGLNLYRDVSVTACDQTFQFWNELYQVGNVCELESVPTQDGSYTHPIHTKAFLVDRGLQESSVQMSVPAASQAWYDVLGVNA